MKSALHGFRDGTAGCGYFPARLEQSVLGQAGLGHEGARRAHGPGRQRVLHRAANVVRCVRVVAHRERVKSALRARAMPPVAQPSKLTQHRRVRFPRAARPPPASAEFRTSNPHLWVFALGAARDSTAGGTWSQ